MSNKKYERVVANKEYTIDFTEEEFLAISKAADNAGKSVEEFVKEATVECALNLKCLIGAVIEGVKK